MSEEFFGAPHEANESSAHSPTRFPAYVFLNKKGLRAGWRLLIYAAIFLALLLASAFVLGLFLHPARGVFSATAQFSAEFSSFLAAFLAAWVMSRIEQCPLGGYGLPGQGAFGKEFWVGCLFGLFEICLLVGLIAVLGGYSFGTLAEHGGAIAKWAIYWASFFLVVGFFEEFFFRGYTLYTLADGIGFWPAAFALAACFGGVHLRNSGEGWVGVLGVVLVGLFWSFTLKRTGSLWFALGMHASFDFGETFLFSVPDSGMIFPGHLSNATLHGPNWLTGGTPGPEGSGFNFLILIAFFFIFDRLYPGRKQTRSGPTPY